MTNSPTKPTEPGPAKNSAEFYRWAILFTIQTGDQFSIQKPDEAGPEEIQHEFTEGQFSLQFKPVTNSPQKTEIFISV